MKFHQTVFCKLQSGAQISPQFGLETCAQSEDCWDGQLPGVLRSGRVAYRSVWQTTAEHVIITAPMEKSEERVFAQGLLTLSARSHG